MGLRKSVLAACVAALFSVSAVADPLINEFMPNPLGADPSPQGFELLGTPGASYSGFIVNIESDPGGSNPGDINGFEAVSGTFDANGILLLSVNDFENPSFTIALMDTFTGSTSTDIDANDDGVPEDLSTFGTVRDAIGIRDDATPATLLYGAALGGTDMGYIGDEPQLVFRDSVTLALYAVDDVFGDPVRIYDDTGTEVNAGDFNIDPLVNTFGGVNPTIPEPATLVLLAMGGLTVLRRRS